MGWCSEEARVDFGERLKTAIASFTVDFLPHMREEEEVCVCVCVRGGGILCVSTGVYYSVTGIGQLKCTGQEGKRK